MSDCPHGQSLTDTRYALVKKDAHLLKTSAIYILRVFFVLLSDVAEKLITQIFKRVIF